jgi:OOP family OmpA-OmpF porin
MKKFVLNALIASAAMAPVLVQAQSAYVGAGILVSNYHSGGNLQYSTDTGSQADTGFKLYTGYHVNDKFGIEAGYVDLGEAVVAGKYFFVKPRSFYFAGTGTWQVSRRFALTGKLGVAASRSKFSNLNGSLTQTENNTSLMAGFGTVFTITKRVQGVVELEHFGKVVDVGGGTLKANTFSTSVRFNF